MAQRTLIPPSGQLYIYTELDISKLIDVYEIEKKHVVEDRRTDVRDGDFGEAIHIVADAAIIPDRPDYQEVDRTPEQTDTAYIGNEHSNEEHGHIDQTLFGSCMYCSQYKRMKTDVEIQPGDSIRFPRKGGIYYHHAIVTGVQKGYNSRCCKLTLIYLQKIGRPMSVRVIKETKTCDLNAEIIERVIYKAYPFTSAQIIERAEEYVAKDTSHIYQVVQNNCEHVANEIAQGVKRSDQVRSMLNYGINWILNVLFKIGSKILQLSEMIPMVSICSLTELIMKMSNMRKFFLYNSVCSCCFKQEYTKLKISFVLGVISLAVGIIIRFNSATFTIDMIINMAMPCASKVVYHMMPLIQPVFLIPKKTLSINNIPKDGDIITFDYQNLPHEGVVSDVGVTKSDMTRLKATIIHFPWPGFFRTYTVTEETIYFNKSDVSVLNFKGKQHFSATDVVMKAKNLVGTQNHSYFTYRSSHLSRECKTGKKYIDTLQTVPVQSIDDLSPGDVIRFRYYGFPFEAVLVKIAEAEDITLDVIHYNYTGIFGTRKVVEEEMTFKLSDDNLYIHDYANVDVYKPNEVVRRARRRIGEEKFNTFTNRSSHLAKSCKMKQN